VVETPPGSPGNAVSDSFIIGGYAIDDNGTLHWEPGNTSGTDPFQYVQEGDFNTALWANGTVDSPKDPISLLYNNYQ
jgi:hypothetical protein